jgi:hypothetical protein
MVLQAVCSAPATSSALRAWPRIPSRWHVCLGVRLSVCLGVFERVCLGVCMGMFFFELQR